MTTQQPEKDTYTGGGFPLAEGERYIGGIVDSAGVTTHIILLPGEFEGSWKQSMEWAAEQGGDLPNRVEQALLFATAKDAFEPTWYWSNTEHASDSGWAWVQDFNDGFQDGCHKGDYTRARAVRRLVI